MVTRRGKRAAWTAGVLVVVVLAGTGYALRDWMRETYHLHWLEHGDEKSQDASAKSLSEMRSVRAVPALIEKVGVVAQWPPDRTGGHPDPEFTSTGETILVFPVPERAFLFVQALIDIGPGALPELLDALATNDTIVACLYADAIHAIGSTIPELGPFEAPEYFSPEAILPVLEALAGQERQEGKVREAAAAALRKVRAAERSPPLPLPDPVTP